MTEPRLSDFTTRRFWLAFGGRALATVGLIAALAGLYDVLFPDQLPRVKAQALTLTAAAALIAGIVRAWPRPVRENFLSPNVTIRILPGDLLDHPCHLVIGMTTTFDTAPGVIASTSLQAQLLAKFFDGDTARLDRELDQVLAPITPDGSVDKLGKTTTYPMGTVAVLDGNGRRFFCLAYSRLDGRNVAEAAIADIITGLASLWDAVCAHGNGKAVAMPVIGGGQSRLSHTLGPAEAMRLQVLSFWLASRERPLS